MYFILRKCGVCVDEVTITDAQHSGIPDVELVHMPPWMTRYEADHLSGSCQRKQELG